MGTLVVHWVIYGLVQRVFQFKLLEVKYVHVFFYKTLKLVPQRVLQLHWVLQLGYLQLQLSNHCVSLCNNPYQEVFLLLYIQQFTTLYVKSRIFWNQFLNLRLKQLYLLLIKSFLLFERRGLHNLGTQLGQTVNEKFILFFYVGIFEKLTVVQESEV